MQWGGTFADFGIKITLLSAPAEVPRTRSEQILSRAGKCTPIGSKMGHKIVIFVIFSIYVLNISNHHFGEGFLMDFSMVLASMLSSFS